MPGTGPAAGDAQSIWRPAKLTTATDFIARNRIRTDLNRPIIAIPFNQNKKGK